MLTEFTIINKTIRLIDWISYWLCSKLTTKNTGLIEECDVDWV